MKTECLLCDAPVLNSVYSKELALCAPCREELQRKVDRAVLDIDADMMGGLTRPMTCGRRVLLAALLVSAIALVGLVLREVFR